MRMDGRLDWADLLMRIEYPGTTTADENKFRNRLLQKMARARERFSMVSWRNTAGDSNPVRDRVLSKLTPAQLAARGGLGSTRGSTPASRDDEGRMIGVPRRPARATVKVENTAARVQQPKARTANSGSLNASSQQNYPIASTGFSAVIPEQQQSALPYRGSGNGQMRSVPEVDAAAMVLAGPLHQMTLPIMGGRKDHVAANTMKQQNESSRPPAVLDYTQQVQNNVAYGGQTGDEYSLPQESDARLPPFDDMQTGICHAGASDGQFDTFEILYPPSSEGSDGDDEDDGSDENDESEGSVDIEDNDRKEGTEKYDGSYLSGHGEQLDTDMEADSLTITEDDPCMAGLSLEMRRGLIKHFEQERMQIQAYCRGKISGDELMTGIETSHAELKSCLKRTRCQISSDEEVEEMQNPRVKRTRRGACVTGSSGELNPEDQELAHSGCENSQPGPSGEYNRQGTLAKPSRRLTARPVGSAVQKLHRDRQRRPASKATQANIIEMVLYAYVEIVWCDMT